MKTGTKTFPRASAIASALATNESAGGDPAFGSYLDIGDDTNYSESDYREDGARLHSTGLERAIGRAGDARAVLHEAVHEELIMRFAFGQSEHRRAARQLLCSCDECMALGYRMVEDAYLLTPSSASQPPYLASRLEPLLEEAAASRL